MKSIIKYISLYGMLLLFVPSAYGMHSRWGSSHFSEITEEQAAQDHANNLVNTLNKYLCENPHDIPEVGWMAGAIVENGYILHISKQEIPSELKGTFDNNLPRTVCVSMLNGCSLMAIRQKESEESTNINLSVFTEYIKEKDDKTRIVVPVAPKTLCISKQPKKDESVKTLTLSIPFSNFRKTEDFKKLKALRAVSPEDKEKYIALLAVVDDVAKSSGMECSFFNELEQGSSFTERFLDCYAERDVISRKLDSRHTVKQALHLNMESKQYDGKTGKSLPFSCATAALNSKKDAVVLSITTRPEDEKFAKVSKLPVKTLVKVKEHEISFDKSLLFYDKDVAKVTLPSSLTLSSQDSDAIVQAVAAVYTEIYSNNRIDLRPLERALEKKLGYKEKEEIELQESVSDSIKEKQEDITKHLVMTIVCGDSKQEIQIPCIFEDHSSATNSSRQKEVVSLYLPDATAKDADQLLSSLLQPPVGYSDTRYINLSALKDIIQAYGVKKSPLVQVSDLISAKAKILAKKTEAVLAARSNKKESSSAEIALQESRDKIRDTAHYMIQMTEDGKSSIASSVVIPAGSTSTDAIKISSNSSLPYSATSSSATTSRFFLWRWAQTGYTKLASFVRRNDNASNTTSSVLAQTAPMSAEFHAMPPSAQTNSINWFKRLINWITFR